MRILRAVPLTALLLLVGCARPGVTPQNTLPSRATATASPVPSVEATGCPASGLRFTVDRGDAAMGYREMGLHVRNCGDAPVTVSGRPEVVVLGKDQDPQDIAVVPYARQDRPVSAHPVVLAPGRSTMAILAWHSTYDDISKPPVSGEYLAVAAAPGQARQIVRPPVALDLGSTGRLQVSDWI